VKAPRISNPDEWVEFEYEDKGDVSVCYDDIGNPCEGYTSRFVINGQEYTSILFKPVNGNIGMKRSILDMEFMKKHDIDLERME
jgi:hypothetical protein